MTRRIVLASSSPRRKELLQQIGLEPLVFPVDVDESSVRPIDLVSAGVPAARVPAETCLRRSRLKMDAATKANRSSNLLLAADTVVSVDGVILDKPADVTDATQMLKLLSGRTHSVFTAVVMTDPDTERRIEEIDHTRVTFDTITEGEITWYLHSSEWQNVAGGYRIQGMAAAFVTRIDGSYSTVMGLPIHTVYSMIKRLSS